MVGLTASPPTFILQGFNSKVGLLFRIFQGSFKDWCRPIVFEFESK